jgi:segregation and condensation protein A
MSDKEEIKMSISKEPVNILFTPSSISKKDVWEIDLIRILDTLIEILQKSEKKDLRIAGMAALSSALIYRMKVESIFALQKAAMQKEPLTKRNDIDIEMINIPYRHESTYPVSLEELLNLLENLIGSMANPRSRKRGQDEEFWDKRPPPFEEYFVSLENVIGKYEDLIMRKISKTGFGFLKKIVEGLEPLDAIRCFFAILFLARDEKIDIEQEDYDTDIKVMLIKKDNVERFTN